MGLRPTINPIGSGRGLDLSNPRGHTQWEFSKGTQEIRPQGIKVVHNSLPIGFEYSKICQCLYISFILLVNVGKFIPAPWIPWFKEGFISLGVP